MYIGAPAECTSTEASQTVTAGEGKTPGAPRAYVARRVDALLDDLMRAAPAVLLTGPRASGKTTTALRHVQEVVRLDRPAEAEAWRADPDAALVRMRHPLLIDEWQVVPEVLGAVKRAVDADPAPGRFLVTGSVRADLQDETWPGTGRLVRVPVWPLTQRELAAGGSGGVLDALVEAGPESLPVPADPPDLPGYLDLAVAGGLPPAALAPDAAYRRRWYLSYLEQLTTRDAALLAGGRDPVRLRRHLDGLAEQTAGLPSDVTVAEAAGIDRRTAAAYDDLLAALGVLDVVPAWSTNRLKRLVQRGKRYLTDTGLAAAALRVDTSDLLRDGVLLGRLLDTFVAGQLRTEISASGLHPTLHHVRDRDGREVDLLVDYGRRGALAIEVKASAAPRPDRKSVV